MKYRIVEMRDRFYIEKFHEKIIGHAVGHGEIVETVWYQVNVLGQIYKGEKDYPRLKGLESLETAKEVMEQFKKGPIIHEV